MSYDSDHKNIDYRSTLSLTRVHNALARENPDRVAESRPVSLWISLGAIAVAAIGAASFGANRGFGLSGPVDYNKFGANYRPVAPPAVVPEDSGKAQDPFKLGEKVYKNKCVTCHLPNGLGQPGQYPPLDGSEWVTGGTERMAMIIGFGLAGPITVKGQTYSSAIMPPHGPPVLTLPELAAVMTYIRGSWSNKADPVSVEGVTDFIKRHAGRTAQSSEAELNKIPAEQMLIGSAPPAPGSTPAAPSPGAAPTAAPAQPSPSPQ
jgi:mono/diheme cytochrome c family protein